jgi:hypothetical protein
MLRVTTAILFVGVILACVAAALLAVQSPQGLLLYTPGPNAPARYTPSSVIGFVLTIAVLAGLSLVVAAVTGALAWKLNGRWSTIAKSTAAAGLGFVSLIVIASLTERLWP